MGDAEGHGLGVVTSEQTGIAWPAMAAALGASLKPNTPTARTVNLILRIVWHSRGLTIS